MFGRKVKNAARALLLALAVGVCAAGCGDKYRNEAEKKYLKDAKKGNAEAQYKLGASYEFGGGAPKDIDLAKKWYEKAARQGHKKAQARLRILTPPKPPTEEEAKEFRKNALKYDPDPEALFRWAECCEFGLHAEKDRDLALRYYSRAAAKGHVEAKARAQALSGEMLARISEADVKKFRADALRGWNKGKNNGNAEAQYQFARCLEFGIHVPQDDGAARTWYVRAANQGHAKAMNMLGRKPKKTSAKPKQSPSKPKKNPAKPASKRKNDRRGGAR